MDEHQFKDLFDMAISHTPDHGLNDDEQSELLNNLYDSFEHSFREEKSQYGIPEKLAPAMVRVMAFAGDLEDIREGKSKLK